MKKGLKALLTALLATSCCSTVIAFTGCSNKGGGGDENPPPPACTEHVDVDEDGFCDNCNEAMPNEEPGDEEDEDEYTISIDGKNSNDLDIGDSVDLKWNVYKNGVKMNTPAAATVTLNNDNVTFDKATGKITAAKKGSTTATVTLDSDSSVKATVRYTVHDYFFNHKLDRGEWSSAFEDADVNPRITITGGQAAVLVKEAATKFVFKYKLNMGATDIPTNQSFGIASFLPTSGAGVGDNALWFGMRGTNKRGVFGAFVKQFYTGWGTGDEYIQGGYAAMDIGFQDVELVIIRDGLDYYYSIGGYYEKYTVKDAEHADVATYAGIYSQTVGFDVSDYSWSNVQADVDAAIKEYYTDRGVAAISINESYKTEIVKGMYDTYTAAAYPTKAASGVTLEWSLDKEEMTDGAEGTTVSVDNGMATVSIADPAAGTVYLVCSTEVDGEKVYQRLPIEILQKNLMDSNDHITVYGGVEINNKDSEDWSVTFPETRMTQNGISITGDGNEHIYQQTKYCAILNTNYSKDYTLEFKFSNYKNNKSAPKLQVSLGADRSNFYLVYNAGSFRVESNTQGTQSNGFTTAGWHNTEWISDFNPNAEHTFKLTISDRGVYSVFIDGQQYGFYAVGGNQELTNPTTIVRKYSAYDEGLPIKFATDGCSVTLSDITVTNGTHASSDHNFWSEHQSYEFPEHEEDSFKMTVPIITDPNADGWQYGQWADYKTYYTKHLDDGGYAIDLDVTFGATMTDGKFIMRVGNNGVGSYEIQFNNKGAGLFVAYKKDNNWTGSFEKAAKVDATNPLKVKARVEVRDGKIRVIANGRTVLDTAYDTTKISSNSTVEFYMFNATQADVWSTANPNKYAEVSNFAVSDHNFTAADVYELQNTANDNNIDIIYSMDNTPQGMPVRVLHNGAVFTPDNNYKLAYALTSDDKAYFEFDATNGTICGKNLEEGAIVEGTVTVMLKNADGDILDSIDYHVAAYNKATSNNYVEVKGGVILDSDGATDDKYSLTFPMSKIGVNGVGAESKYEDNDYSANLKTTVKGDFSIEFTVSDYVSEGSFPKLMISLGGNNNQFYVVYNRQGTINHIESFVNATSTRGHDANGWISSSEFTNFNTATKHTYKITCVSGIYHVYLDGVELDFSYDSDNENSKATLYRNFDDYAVNRPIRISTNGVSATVSDIKITDLNGGNEVTMPTLYSAASKVTMNGTDGFTITLDDTKRYNNDSNCDDWTGRYGFYEKIHYMDALTNDCAIEYDVVFGKTNPTDSKLILELGNYEYHIINKNGNLTFYLFAGNWTGPELAIPAAADGSKSVHFRMERKNGQARIIANGKVLGVVGANNNNALKFWGFNTTAADIGSTITLSNLFVEGTDFTAQSVYEIEAVESNITVIPDNAPVAVAYKAYADNGTRTEISAADLTAAGITVSYSITGSDKITLDNDNKVSATGVTDTETATVTVSLKKGSAVLDSVNIGITATARETENTVLSVSGGVELNYTNTPDEDGWSVTFPESKISEDGIVDETKYVSATYSADLKKKIGVSENAVLQFTVTNFVTQGEAPKLMASLGGTHNQFYFVYRQGLGFRLEVMVPRINGDGNFWEDDGWLRSESGYDSTFDASIPHTFKIELTGGIYKVYRKDGNGEFAEIIVGEEWPAGSYTKGSHTMATSYNDYMSQKNVRISTHNTACTISNVSLETSKSNFYYSAPLVSESNNTVIIKAHKLGFSNVSSGDGKKDRTQAYYIPGLANNQTMTFDLTFNEAMADGKFAINIASANFFIDNKIKNDNKTNLCRDGEWGNRPITGLNAPVTINVTVARNGGSVTITIAVGSDSVSMTDSIDADNSSIFFWMFNSDEADQNATATVSNIVVTNS